MRIWPVSTGRQLMSCPRTRDETFDAVVVCAAIDSVDAAAPARAQAAAGPRLRLFRHRPAAQARCAPRHRPARRRHGRTLQGGRQPLRRTSACRGWRRAGRQSAATQQGRARDAVQGAPRLVPRRSPHEPGAASGRVLAPCCPTAPRSSAPAVCPACWLNLGHGSSGWALACGSARVVADAYRAGRLPSISKVWGSNACADS